MRNDTMKEPERTPPRKRPYTAPTLVRYGDVGTLTQANIGGPLKDNGKASKIRSR